MARRQSFDGVTPPLSRKQAADLAGVRLLQANFKPVDGLECKVAQGNGYGAFRPSDAGKSSFIESVSQQSDYASKLAVASVSEFGSFDIAGNRTSHRLPKQDFDVRTQFISLLLSDIAKIALAAGFRSNKTLMVPTLVSGAGSHTATATLHTDSTKQAKDLDLETVAMRCARFVFVGQQASTEHFPGIENTGTPSVRYDKQVDELIYQDKIRNKLDLRNAVFGPRGYRSFRLRRSCSSSPSRLVARV